ncbi:MAG: RagB/SusD family nutrient uptake outer membrane protein [Cyclobacteriaceae bacterium]
MKIHKSILKYIGALILALFVTTSCEDYLDQAPEAAIAEDEVFSKFVSFQGYMEDIYQCIVDETLGTDAYVNWNYGDDVLEDRTDGVVHNFDQGNYSFWTHSKASQFWGTIGIANDNGTSAKGKKGYWQHGWYGIRKANTALRNLSKLTSGTQEERDLIAGQAYFFRGYLHFEIMRSWGGVAYVDSVYSPTDEIRLPRLSYRETALKAAADFRKAAELLPASWDETIAGQATAGQNDGRITKGAALGYLGKNLLYAASPLMNGVSTGSYTYDEALCSEAAEVFDELIQLANQGYHSLRPWADYFKNFYTLVAEMPIGTEVIFNNPVYMYKRWNYGEHQLQVLGGWGMYASPTANYVEYFGMNNGLPIGEADSGYDPMKPWDNREPRFYYNIVKGGDRLITTANASKAPLDEFAQFQVGGRHRNPNNSISGYGHTKFRPLTANNRDNGWGNNFFYECPQMRLADIYLMYAEAVNEAFGPMGSVGGGPTAIEAVNIIRSRAQVADIDSRFTGTKETFREAIRVERAVELAFEGHRWFDLRRWYVSHLPQYREKYELEYDKDQTYFKKVLARTIVFEEKHYWLPFAVGQVTLYPEFEQNPGW